MRSWSGLSRQAADSRPFMTYVSYLPSVSTTSKSQYTLFSPATPEPLLVSSLGNGTFALTTNSTFKIYLTLYV